MNEGPKKIYFDQPERMSEEVRVILEKLESCNRDLEQARQDEETSRKEIEMVTEIIKRRERELESALSMYDLSNPREKKEAEEIEAIEKEVLAHARDLLATSQEFLKSAQSIHRALSTLKTKFQELYREAALGSKDTNTH